MGCCLVVCGVGSGGSWYKQRRYLHFDCPVSFDFASEYVKNSVAVARHQFWPFLSYDKVVWRYKRKEGKVVPKIRPIMYAAHLDSHVYSWYACLLLELYERRLLECGIGGCVLAYRKLGRNNIHFAKEAFDCVLERVPCVALTFDISDFFGSMSHSLLKSMWVSLLDERVLPDDHFSVYRSITRYSHVRRDGVYKLMGISRRSPFRGRVRICSPGEFRDRVRREGFVVTNGSGVGIPQGSPISAVLSNVYLLSVDRVLAGLAAGVGGVYRRYCDDVLFVCSLDVVEEVRRRISQEFLGVRLCINEDKTTESAFGVDGVGRVVCDKPLQYLGFVYDGRSVVIRGSTQARFFRRMKAAVRQGLRRAAKNVRHPRLYRKSLYRRYSHLGFRNFVVNYVRQAKVVLSSDAVRRQSGRLWMKLNAEIEKKS